MKNLIPFNFYVVLEKFGMVAGFNTEEECSAYVKHEVELIYEGMDNERKKERAMARKEYSIITKADDYNGYVVSELFDQPPFVKSYMGRI
jgi:hypothetical protein